MSYDWEEEGGMSRLSRARRWLSRRVRNGLRYAFVGLALLAAYNFFAPVAGVPSFAPYMAYLPSIAAPTESRTAVIEAMHIVVLAASAAIATRF